MELIFICAVCIVIGVIIGQNSSPRRRSYENHNRPKGPPPLKLKKSLKIDYSDEEIENKLREAFIRVVGSGGYQPIKQQGNPEPPPKNP